MTNVIDTNI